MRVTLIGHAAILVEANGLRILSDPWWEGPCFGTQWWVCPRPALGPIDGQIIDYIYISHGHHDHLHLGTLRRLPQSARILAPAGADFVAVLRNCGFTVMEVAADEELDLGRGVRCRIMPTCNDDSLMAISDGAAVCLNLNDALHAAPQGVQDRIINRLKTLYPVIDYVFCGYGIASHFPNCYVLPGVDRAATAIRRQAHFNRQWARIIAALGPRHAFPFAADVAILEEDLIWANAPVRNAERPTDVFRATHPGAATQVYDIAPGFAMDGDRVVAEALFAPLDPDELRQSYAAEYAVANRPSKVPADGVAALAETLAGNVALCRDYLMEFSGNYRALVTLRDADRAIVVEKAGGAITVTVEAAAKALQARHDLRFATRFSYLRRALIHPYGGEVLYVGSGCLIEYLNPAMVGRNLHRELLTILRHRTAAPASRFGDQSRTVYLAKTLVKRLLGRSEPDLYDLGTWAVPAGDGAQKTSGISR